MLGTEIVLAGATSIGVGIVLTTGVGIVGSGVIIGSFAEEIVVARIGVVGSEIVLTTVTLASSDSFFVSTGNVSGSC